MTSAYLGEMGGRNMLNKRSVGENGEKRAVEFVKSHDALVIDRNFYFRGGEIDLILKDFSEKEPYLCFVEVKYRTDNKMGNPEEAVNIRKQKRIIKGAYFYMNLKGISYSTPCRFDIITICGEEIRWIKNAFTL